MADATQPCLGNMPRVLVLLATFNGARWLDEQLDSIFAQRQVRVTVLASDDGSLDDTLVLLQRRAAGPQPVGILSGAGIRLGAAGNFLRLLREAPVGDFDFIALADQDDVWLQDRLARAIRQLADSGAQGYSSDATAFWQDGRRRPLGKGHAQRRFDHLFEPAGPGCTYLLSTPLATALQQELRRDPHRFEGLGYHDWLIYAFARVKGFRWVIDPTPGVEYRQHDGNELGANFGTAAVQRRWGRLRSGWFRDQVLQIASLWPSDHDEVARRMRRLQWRDRLWLARRASSLRRRPRDQLALAVMLALFVLR
jgi:rhamnosyltransferase